MDYVTWADFHPEVAEIFDSLWDYRKIDWSCEQTDTGVGPVYQPSIVTGPDQELFVAGPNGQVFHSQDGGKTWAMLCGPPAETHPEIPDALKPQPACSRYSAGIGVSGAGTLILVWTTGHEAGIDQSSQRTWMTRSEDRGQTWKATELLDPSPYGNLADQCTLVQLRDGRLMVPLRSINEHIYRSSIYISSDDGRTWSRLSRFTDHCPEPHLLELLSGRIVASLRYERNKVREDRPALGGCFYHEPSQRDKTIAGGPTAVGRRVFQHTAITSSEDSGRTWSVPRLVTGALAQTGCLVRLSDGTLILTFGRLGQYFMLSYDEGETWSKAVYQLNRRRIGEYARSAALDDDTIITIHDNAGSDRSKANSRGRLMVLRWKAPDRGDVAPHGFFRPREVETGVT